MANAYRLSGCPRSTLRDFIAIAELKKVGSRAFEITLANYQGESGRELEKMCRKSLGRYMPLMSTMRREGQLLPLKFDQRFYEFYGRLSSDCWPTVGRQSANSRTTVNRQSTDKRPTVGRLLAEDLRKRR